MKLHSSPMQLQRAQTQSRKSLARSLLRTWTKCGDAPHTRVVHAALGKVFGHMMSPSFVHFPLSAMQLVALGIFLFGVTLHAVREGRACDGSHRWMGGRDGPGRLVSFHFVWFGKSNTAVRVFSVRRNRRFYFSVSRPQAYGIRQMLLFRLRKR